MPRKYKRYAAIFTKVKYSGESYKRQQKFNIYFVQLALKGHPPSSSKRKILIRHLLYILITSYVLSSSRRPTLNFFLLLVFNFTSMMRYMGLSN